MWQSIILIASLSFVSSWECGGDRSELNQPQGGPRHLYTRDSVLSPIRLYFHYLSVDLGSAESTDYFKSVLMPSVQDYFTSTLSVHSVNGAIILPYSNCLSDVIIPDQHKTVGVLGADVVVYVTTKYIPEEPYVAYAGACAIDG